MLDKPRAFTLSAMGLLDSLRTNVIITSQYTTPNTSYSPTMRNAIWDTGASRSTISIKVANELHLQPMGKTQISTANGVVDAMTYIVDIGLPNQVTVKDVLVSCADIGDDVDVLIGMDIITLGDFSITNANARTIFSFKLPSSESIDYVKILKNTSQS